MTTRKLIGKRNPRYRHGMSRTSIYARWLGMRARCEKPTHPRYRDYGGRGITVCAEWHDFKRFYADMGEPPAGRTLDRIDNQGNYCKNNCRWATTTEQANNARRRIFPDDWKPAAKLSASQVSDIHALLNSGYSINRIAKSYKVDRHTITNIKHNHTWRQPSKTGGDYHR